MPQITKKPAKPSPKKPLWAGPEVDGITFSLLSRFLACRERFRLLVVEGLKPEPTFNHRIEYGQMWHVCEEAFAKASPTEKRSSEVGPWNARLAEYCYSLREKYPFQQEQIHHWEHVCSTQFPLYVDYWQKQPDVTARTPLLQEQVFDVPYRLPSGRTIRLRGKWDSVDLIGKGAGAGVYLQENKTKGDVDEGQIKRQMGFDLQTMLYLVALDSGKSGIAEIDYAFAIKGVRYNVIRRPLSGGAGSIVRRKPTTGAKCPKCKGKGISGSFLGTNSVSIPCPKCKGDGRTGAKAGETAAEFYGRLGGIIGDSPETYFFRWKVEVTPGDLADFRKRCLDPLLEQLCDWYAHVTTAKDIFGLRHGIHHSVRGVSLHWQHPFGVRNMLDEGGSTDLDEYLRTGSTVGLRNVDKLFEELG